jgi:hypothetical protein
MRLSSCLKLGSLFAVVGCVACFGIATSGCFDGSGPGHDDNDNNGPSTNGPSATPDQVAIDTNATLTVQPGQGVGVFVEYTAGGTWTVSASCDTNFSQASCAFDVIVAGVDSSTVLSNAQNQNPDRASSVEVRRDGSLHFSSETTTDLDGFTFSAPPGKTIALELLLDGQLYDAYGDPQGRFIYWLGDGVLHTGAPTNPVEFAPTMN